LYSIPQFLCKLYNSHTKLKTKTKLPLTEAFLKVALAIGALKQEDVSQGTPKLKLKAADPSALKAEMDKLTTKFVGIEQRDAHEFLCDLIDRLHEELARSLLGTEKSEESNTDAADDEVAATVVTTNLPTDEYFLLKVKVGLTCKKCGYFRSNEESYRHLSIDVGENGRGHAWGVEQSLELFFQAEDREVKCGNCKKGTVATQTMEIISL
jgi:uncharacterized UBP type Zn finger protein